MPEGHRHGVLAFRRALECCQRWSLPQLTVYAFSKENWQRPRAEVDFVLKLLESTLQSELGIMMEQGVKCGFIGDREGLPDSLLDWMDRVVRETASNSDVQLNLAVNYSARADIQSAAVRAAQLVQQGQLQPEQIDEPLLASLLSSSGLSRQEPDLLIRTSGEQRLSNFLLWEAAYTEFYSSPALWPDWNEEHFAAALHDFASRKRRYGKRKHT